MTRTKTSNTILALTAAGALLFFGIAGCKSSSNTAAPITTANATDPGNDPAADGNLAPTDGTQPASQPASQPTQVLGTSSSYTPQQQSESYPQAPANQDNQDYNNGTQAVDQSYDQPAEYADQAPPPLPEYDQPPAPDPNYLWTPGYWGWGGNGGYYWVPGAWCPPPYYGALWTPPYWGFYGGRYGFHRGYWGPHIGFYGGVNYGFGYIGIGFFGGYWHGHDFFYNRAVTNVGHVTNIYNRTVIYNNVHYGMQPNNRVSFNGGRGGINVQPRPAEMAAMHENRTPPLAVQTQIRTQAAQNRGNFYAANHGRPAEAAIARPIAPAHIAEPPRAVQQEQKHDAQIEQHNNPTAQRNTPAEQPNRNAGPQHGPQPLTPNRGAGPERSNEPQHTTPGVQPQRGPENHHAAASRREPPRSRRTPATGAAAASNRAATSSTHAPSAARSSDGPSGRTAPSAAHAAGTSRRAAASPGRRSSSTPHA
jgi:hypothetical protein